MAPVPHPRVLAPRLLVGALAWSFVGPGCAGKVPPGAASPQGVAMGSWREWHTLAPLVEVASTHAPSSTVEALRRASKLLSSGKVKQADQVLAQAATGAGAHWIAVARADLAAMYFTVCIRGVAWRLSDVAPGGAPQATQRRMEYGEDTRLGPGDVSVEALLSGIEAALAAGVDALAVQARIARARVTAFASRCPPNEEVARRAGEIMETDLAQLAADGQLTPDLAFMWGGVQMSRYSAAAARPFLLQARAGGFDDPSVDFMLAMAALDAHELDQARKLAGEAEAQQKKLGHRTMQAEVAFLRGEIERAAGQDGPARKAYERALTLDPGHVGAVLALASLAGRRGGEEAAVASLGERLPRLLGTPTDELSARMAAGAGEALVAAADEPMLAQAVRDALITEIEADPSAPRRALRYFFAAVLEARLAEYERARGHALLAREELSEIAFPMPLDIEEFLASLDVAG